MFYGRQQREHGIVICVQFRYIQYSVNLDQILKEDFITDEMKCVVMGKVFLLTAV